MSGIVCRDRGGGGCQYEIDMSGYSQSWASTPLSDIDLVMKSKILYLIVFYADPSGQGLQPLAC